MPILDIAVASGADDDLVRRLDSPAWWNNLTYVQAGAGGAGASRFGSSMRFTGVNIPPDATIVEAHVTMVAAAANPAINVYICAENSSNPGQIANYADHIGRTRTPNVIATEGMGDWVSGAYDVGPYASSIQKVVDDNGGTGDALILFWEDPDGLCGVGQFHQASSYDGGTAPILHVEYSLGTPSGKGVKHSLDGIAFDEFIRAVNLSLDNTVHDKTVATSTAKASHEGWYGWRMDAEYNYDAAVSGPNETIWNAIMSGQRAVTLRPGGGTIGLANPEYAGSCYVADYSIDIPHRGVVRDKAIFQGTGALSRNTS